MEWKTNPFMCLTGTGWFPLAEFSLAEVSRVPVQFGFGSSLIGQTQWANSQQQNFEIMSTCCTGAAVSSQTTDSLSLFTPALVFLVTLIWTQPRAYSTTVDGQWKDDAKIYGRTGSAHQFNQNENRQDLNETPHHFIEKLEGKWGENGHYLSRLCLALDILWMSLAWFASQTGLASV